MKSPIDTLFKEIMKVEQARAWTAEVLEKEVGRSSRELLNGYISEYDEQIAQHKRAIEVLRREEFK